MAERRTPRRNRSPRPKQRDELLAFGRNVVSTLVSRRPQDVRELLLAKGQRDRALQSIAAQAQRQGLTVIESSASSLDALAEGQVHQGIAARLHRLPHAELSELLVRCKTLDSASVVLLDGITDPRNLGAIARSALAFGTQALIFPRDRNVGLTPAAFKTSAGALWELPAVPVTNLRAAIDKLKEAGFWIYGTVVDGGESLAELRPSPRWALIIGGEDRGLRAKTREACDHLLHIPMPGGFESLNASVAAGVALYGLSQAAVRATR